MVASGSEVRARVPGAVQALTAARAVNQWLREGSQMVQQQALRDFAQAILSTGELLHCPGLTDRERVRLRRLERKLARAQRNSNRRREVKAAVARVKARETARRKDWAEKASTDLARRFDVIRVENLSQARFRCTACGFACNADVNAARNIAAGHAVKARGGDGASRPGNREPQHALLTA